MTKYTCSKTTDFTTSGGVVDQQELWPEVETATTKSLASITELDDENGNVGDEVEFDFGAESLDAGQQTALTTACNDHGVAPLRQAKRDKSRTIDRRTRRLIKRGFTHSAKQFSLSEGAQDTLNFVFGIRADLAYPIKWNTKDDDDATSFADGPEFKAFYTSAVTTLRSHLDSGTALKDSVRAATTIAEVDAVVDNR